MALRQSLLRFATAVAVVLSAGCVQSPRFGNYGGQHQPAPPPKESPSATGVLWHPIQARFAPDGRYLIVNLCRSSMVGRDDCRLAEYWLSEDRWHLLPVDPGHSHMWPSFSPDGQRLALVDLPCDAERRCNVLAGQLVTMPAHGGDETHYPVFGVRGPVFHPDGKRIAYWRYHGVGRLASGRISAGEAIYELDTTSNQETNWLDNARTPLGNRLQAFDWSIAGPFYHPDGDSLQFCGYASGNWTVNTTITCARLGRNGGSMLQIKRQAIDSRFPKNESSVVISFGSGSPTTFVGQSFIRGRTGRSLAVIDSTTFQVRQELLGFGGYTVGDADYSAAGNRVVVLVGFLMNSGDRRFNEHHWIVDPLGIDKNAYPAMALVDLGTLKYRAIEWPNVESIHH